MAFETLTPVESTQAGQRPSKRPRKALSDSNDTQISEETSISGSSADANRLFVPFRALGLVTNHIPFVLQTRSFKGATDGPRVHILTCLGRSWALWEGGKMTLLFVGTEQEEEIHELAMDGDFIWAGSGANLVKFYRGKEVNRASNPLGGKLGNLIVFGAHILALTEDGKRLLAWSTVSCELVSNLEFANDFTACTLLHPSTYLNKVLIGSVQGSIQLWNISTRSLIYTFPYEKVSDSPSRVQGGQGSSITCMVQSPAIDVVAIGFVSGEIVIYDVRTDERLMRMWQEGGSVKGLAFRGDGEGVLASASSNGHITLWDLSAGGRLLHIIRGAHDASVSTVEWIPGQPVLISSGADNSVKQWLFDSPTSPPRLHKFRSGHFSPPHLIRYYGSDGKALLTASRDRSVRYMSVIRDSRSTELSQGHLAKKATSLSIPIASLKFTPISSLSFSTTRSKDWDDVLTAHTEESFARTWSVQNKRHGKYHLPVHETSSPGGKSSGAKKGGIQGSVKAVHVTSCGNFGLAGNSKGMIGMWNMQSGIRRKTFKLPTPGKEGEREKVREGARVVIGLATDTLNRVVIAATLDGTVYFFDFHTTELSHTLSLPAFISSLHLQRDSNLLALTCDDLTVRLLDVSPLPSHPPILARELTGFKGRILDMDFSSDSRWIITTSVDGVIRTFDVPTGRMIDAFKTRSLCTSLSFSPTGDFLATAHVDSVGVYLWANRSQYTDVSFRNLATDEEKLISVDLPGVEGMVEDSELPDISSLEINSTEDVFSSPKQLEGDLITLTLLPRSRWQSLLHLDTIQARNKPKEPPKAPEKAPFFLPSLPGTEHRFDTSKESGKEEGKEKGKKKLVKLVQDARSVLQQKLTTEDEGGDYHDLFEYIKTLSPAAIDLELRTLSSIEDLALFIHALENRLKSHRDFEAVQSLIAVFLKIHAEVLIQNEEMEPLLRSLMESQKRESKRIIELLTGSLGTLNFVRNID